MQVFDQGGGHNFFVAQGAHEDGHLRQPGQARGAPAAFTGHDLIGGVVGHRPHQQRLDDALGFDGIGQLPQAFRIKMPTRLVRIGPQDRYRQHADVAALFTLWFGTAEKRIQSPTQSFACVAHIFSLFRLCLRLDKRPRRAAP